ncbi:Glycosyl transferase family 11 [Butyrivibrio sp. Su6]|uniref:alpha-1,2-fucosyltransferase n=1 Tax=Butyrivibrio sp. Su6 TaxID=1520810 RepID=UPI00089E1375|nr:alpha-1,2-fucosyltransferase [Butyrivibrio sp. Su6]SEG15960.1 Glycosyl transferase family 11 [Butyrivibrio sp. Su6]
MNRGEVKDKIIIKFGGGLGNQLFDYIFYEWVKKEFIDKEVLADLSYFNLEIPHDSLGIWQVFPNINLKKATFAELYSVTGEVPIFYGGPLKHKINSARCLFNDKFFRRKDDIIYKNDNDWVSPEEAKQAIISGKKFFDSYWQDSAYFQKVFDYVAERLQFQVSGEISHEKEMKKSNAVSVHIRRGDYVGTIFDKEVNEDYYKRAVEYINNKVDDPHFFIFSDDLEYVTETYDWIENKTIVSGHDGKKSYIDMYLMSLTPNSIIANSTFSLWAAYLNKNANPLIVYPAVEYMQHKKMNDWIGL